ncbi:MAG: phosphoribosylanthranilate isomerase [Bacteroidales bacterium]
MLKIKVCGLTDPVNVQEIALISPDYMGFIFYPGSSRYIGDKPADSLFRSVPSPIRKTGVFVNEKIQIIIDSVKMFGLDLVQLHGNEQAEYCGYLKNEGLTIIKAFGINNLSDFTIPEPYMDVCDYFLFDTNTAGYGGSGNKFDWARINKYLLDKPFFLGGGIGPEDAPLIKQLKHPHLFAVDINSRFETMPGIKEPEKVKDFINEIKA